MHVCTVNVADHTWHARGHVESIYDAVPLFCYIVVGSCTYFGQRLAMAAVTRCTVQQTVDL